MSYSQDFALSIAIDQEPPDGGGGACASLRFADGSTYRFAAADGTELDAWHDPRGRFVQRCILCTHPDLPAFRAYYRPDADGSREEWVFELGDPWIKPVGVAAVSSDNPCVITTKAPHGLRTGDFARMDGLSYSGGNCKQQIVTVLDATRLTIPLAVTTANSNATVGPWDLGAYDATITTADGTECLPIAVPCHYQYARWRWQSEPRCVRRWTTGTPCSAEEAYAELVAANLVPAYDPTLAIHPLPAIPEYTPMSLCGLPSDQGTTGGRPDIGWCPSWHAEYLFRGADEVSFRAHAEAANSYQWCIRDPRTGAPLSLDDVPGATIGWNAPPNVWVPKTDRNRPEAGHMPTLAYVPYLLTGDPYHLESLQFYSNMGFILGPGSATARISLGAGHRYIAWPIRNWGQWVAASPESAPSWLLPRSYAVKRLDASRELLAPKMTADDPYSWLHHAIPLDGNLGDTTWQHGFLSLVAAWLVAVGRSEWREFATWIIQGEVDRTSSTSGYQRSNPSPYSLWGRNVQALAVPLSATDTALVFKLPVPTFAPGEVVSIDSPTEQVTLVECVATDRTVWNIARSTPKAHSAGVNVWGRKFTSWPEVMDCNRIMAPERWVVPSTDTLYADQNQEYQSFHYAAMAMAQRAGLQVPDLEANASWLVAQMRTQLSAKHIGSNWCLSPTVQPPVRESDKELLRRLLRYLLELIG